uniref:Uncharacterized protein LOC104217941 n=1 Tax=Nicotiana sylvestris TaxID=4096 RepID=A0A1U7VX92_NICSY|nr:PREDICTED: uncharacterized protein LOC104217941 [Nicotiana sylvestris]
MGSAPTAIQASKCNNDEKPVEVDLNNAARKLNFSVNRADPTQMKPTLADVVKGNKALHQGMKLDYYAPVIKERTKIVRLNRAEVAEQTQKCKETVIGFNYEDDKNNLIQQGPYTFHNRPLILKQWEPNFQMNKELTRKIPIWMIFQGLPIQYWTQENLGRIASYLGKPICSDRLTAEGVRISYARILVEMDVSQELPDDMLIEKKEEEG